MLGIIGVGQGGSMIADKFSSNGFPAIAINYSERDLESCSNIQNKIRLFGSEGVGKERELATQLMNDNWETVLSNVKKNFSHPSIQVIFIIFSTGGGTGSGVSPMLIDLLQNDMEDKVFVACPILPSHNESVVAHINTLECLKQLSQLDVCILPIDNSNIDASSKHDLYKKANDSFYKLINSILEQTEQNSPYGNLDQRDLIALLSNRGFTHIAHVDISKLKEGLNLSKESVCNSIKLSWRNSIITKPSLTKIIRFGFIFNGQENLMSSISIDDLLSEFDNQPLDIFEGFYTKEKGDVYTILTGLEFDMERLNFIESKTIDDTDNLQNALVRSHSISYKQSNLAIKPKDKEKKTLSNILSKYQK